MSKGHWKKWPDFFVKEYIMNEKIASIALWLMGTVIISLFILRTFFDIEWKWSQIVELVLIYAGYIVIHISKR